jgi:hypothetical protein
MTTIMKDLRRSVEYDPVEKAEEVAKDDHGFTSDVTGTTDNPHSSFPTE